MADEVFPREGSRGSGSCPAFSVQARTSDGRPTKVGNQLFYGEWRTVQFDKDCWPATGVPMGLEPEYTKHGLMSYACAQAMRWWFHAASPTATCLETRILKHKIEHSYTEQIVGAFDTVESLRALCGPSKSATEALSEPEKDGK